MTVVDITLNLPEDVAREAEARGLLNAQTIQELLDRELERRRHIDRLFATMDRLADDPKDGLTEIDVLAEVKAYRAEKRAAHASGR